MKPEDEERLKSVPRMIKAMRERRGWTQSELAGMVGISPGSLHRIENGSGNMQLGTLFKIADALEIDPALLVSRDSEALRAAFDIANLSKERRALALALVQGLSRLDFFEPLAFRYMQVKTFGREFESFDGGDLYPKEDDIEQFKEKWERRKKLLE